jgi:hypothetical protein
MKNVAREDLLEVIGCEIDRRPAEAPALYDLAPLVQRRTRVSGALLVEFANDAQPTVEAFAAAERQCCASIGWTVEPGDVVTLRIMTNDVALDAIEVMFPVSGIEKTQ